MQGQAYKPLSFAIEEANRTEVTRRDDAKGKGVSRYINFKRGIRVVHRNIICPEETVLDYENAIPGKTIIGAVSLNENSGTILYDRKQALTHPPGRFFWGNIPGEKCGAIVPARKEISMVYFSIQKSFFTSLCGRDDEAFSRNDLWRIFNGKKTGVRNLSKTDQALLGALRDLLSNPLRSHHDWLLFESRILDILARNLEPYARTDKARPSPGLTAEDFARVEHAREILISNLETPPSIRTLAGHVGMNDFKLKKAFKAVLGAPVYEYLRNYRLEIAGRLIANGTCSVTEAALEVGYSTPSAFATAFKKKFGVSPSEYRKKIF